MQVRFIVPGKPVSKARPRVTRNGSFTPKHVLAYEKRVGQAAIGAIGVRTQLSGPLAARLAFYHPRPKSRPAHVTREVWVTGGPIWRAVRPDLDNLCKAALDGLKDVLEDGQVVQLEAMDFYAGVDQDPHVDVAITEIVA